MIKKGSELKVEDIFLKVLVAGDYGTGKSVFASTFPGKIFVFDFDNGEKTYKGVDFDYAQYSQDSKGWVEFEKDFRHVLKDVNENKAYATVVIDSATSMTSLAMERALVIDPKRTPAGGPLWNVHYQIVKNLMEPKFKQLISIQSNLVVNCHLKSDTDEDGTIVKIDPLLTGQLATIVPGYFDEVYISTTKPKGGKTAFVLQTITKGLYKARSRLSGKEGLLPEFVPNDYQEIIKEIKKKEEKNES